MNLLLLATPMPTNPSAHPHVSLSPCPTPPRLATAHPPPSILTPEDANRSEPFAGSAREVLVAGILTGELKRKRVFHPIEDAFYGMAFTTGGTRSVMLTSGNLNGPSLSKLRKDRA